MADVQQFERVGDGLLVRAPAKINLSLLIAGKRPDGFHELETIMAKIDWYDELLIEPGGRTGVELVCRGPEWAPQGKENLVYRAAEMILRASGRAADLRLTLVKNVPAGTGLGSASSDAAATLMGLDRHLNLRLPTDSLAEMAGQLGSDVAFFLDGPLAFCTGRGEKIEKLFQSFPFTALLILPPVSVSTKEVYAHYVHEPDLLRQWKNQISAYIRENRVDLVAKMCANMLRRTCFHLFEELGELEEAIESLGLGPICLSGSGSAMYSILSDRDTGRLDNLREAIRHRLGCRSIVVGNSGW
ncbi:MAG: 4-(cytidine 5'-diphospho)-2-C-methyl-D-erythritol kinase [Sedimentisphaerales bacterium]|nr:4-(cytidine 5'-diphospho)-2-C-methyl-D-erythritol kinase [Sedimentisphaerales bacterium]